MKIKRYFIFFIGLFINSLAVSVITSANLGTSPISAIPYVLSLILPLSLGTFTILFSLLLIFIQILLLRKDFQWEDLLQIPISIIFGYFIDLTMIIISRIPMNLYIVKIFYLLIGCLLLSFGVYLEVIANVAMLPGESFVKAVTRVFHTDFGLTKMSFDVSISIIALMISFICTGEIYGVREGTLIAAITVGFFARIFKRKLIFLENILFPMQNQDSIPSQSDTTNHIIVIDRQFGSGGHEIGTALAKQLGYQFYDGELISLTAKKMGYSDDFIRKQEEALDNNYLFDFENQSYVMDAPKDQIFEMESQIIDELAQKSNCVIIGRCADYVLKHQKNCLTIFLHANKEYRQNRIMKEQSITIENIEHYIMKKDKQRAAYYQYYTHQKWGDAHHYAISLDTSLFKDQTVHILYQMIQDYFSSQNQ